MTRSTPIIVNEVWIYKIYRGWGVFLEFCWVYTYQRHVRLQYKFYVRFIHRICIKMSTYKLTYFNSRARAELTRLVFAQAGVEYTDERLTFQEWPARSPHTPFGVLPVLEVDGKQLGGSHVIARYVAEKLGVAGSNDFENALIASILDAVSDMEQQLHPWWFEKDETKKAELLKDLTENTIPAALANIEKFAAGNKDGWLVGSKLTYGDLCVFNTLDFLSACIHLPTILDKFPALSQLKKNVENQPNIAKWIQTRPQTPYWR